jgi:hypothetical protein
MARVDQAQKKQEAERLYEQFGRPLEAEHWGEYVAISPRGETLLGQTPLDVLQRAASSFGPGNFVFKVGERIVFTWR